MNRGFFSRVCLLLTLALGSLLAKAQVTADFSATPLSGCSPLIVQFSDASTGGATQWRWDLGNGSISFLQNPSAAYFNPGKYTIKLVVSNTAGEDSLTKVEYVEVFANPTIDFSSSVSTGCYPLPVDFTDMSVAGSGTITSWLWDFGDGTTSTLQNPSHIYTSARNFNVTLQVRNSNGCVSTFTKTSMIQINSGVLAQFDNDDPQTCKSPVTIIFQNHSTGVGNVNYQWNFGDGDTSSLLNPSHTYTANGTYTIQLIVTNSNGCTDTLVKPNAVTIGTVNGQFSTPAVICQGTGVQFTNTSTPAPASVIWYYGDGNTTTDINGINNYATTGNFTVKMVASFGACTDSATQTINVIAKPVAAFTAADTASCKAPFTVNFTNQSTGSVSYTWDFGDNSTSSLQNPSHTYNNTGSYTVKLVVTNSNGCSDSLIKTNYINITRPVATMANLPDSGCVPFTKTFDVSLDIADPIASYAWNFGDGHNSAGATPTNTYTTEGAYDVSVIVVTAGGCTDTARMSRAIVANNKPVANFSATPLTTCAKNPVTFTNLSTGDATRWLWDFGDSTTSNVRNPNHQYRDTGYFDIKLTIWKGGCSDSLRMPKYVKINAPIARYRMISTCSRPLEKTFIDQSIGADEWYWDFGDGTTSQIKNPVHTYARSGVFTISLRVVNNTTGCDYVISREIIVTNVKAQFTAADTAICRGTDVAFTTGLSAVEINTMNWDFGDGTEQETSPAVNMNHVFDSAGLFSVRLIITDKNGCRDSLTKTNYISVSGPTARFAPGAAGGCLNSSVIFKDSSVTDGTHPIQQWEWQYGDSTSETLTAAPFQHLYTTPGNYVVKLKITDSKGCMDSALLATGVTISNPKASFYALDTVSCPGKLIRFVSQSTGPRLAFNWSFGDNGTSVSENPLHGFNSDGRFTVKLVIKDQYGCTDSLTRTNYITINSPVALFNLSDSVSNCPPLVVSFTNRSTNAQSIRWDFGDSTYSSEASPAHFYNYPGIYYAKLTVTGTGGCTATYQRKITIKGPEGHFTYNPLSGCNPVTVNFAAVTNGRNTFVWDFSDGNTVATADSVLSHIYTHPGKYIPKMILIDRTGCRVPIAGNDTILVSNISNNFSFSERLLCDSGVISFTDSSVITSGDVITSYHWNFGDGRSSDVQNPVYRYNQPGTFYPELITVSRMGCTDTLRSSVPLKIVSSPKASITSTGSGCTPLSVTLSGQLTVPDTSVITWQWNFANGNTAATATPAVQNYTTPGVYNITLIATNSSGCKDTAATTVESYSIPAVSAGADIVLCKGSSKTLEATGADTYRWSPAADLSCTDCAAPSTNAQNNITYTVSGTSANGCSAKDSVTVSIIEKLNITHSSDDSVCAGQSKKLAAAGAKNYSWSPANGLDNPNIAEPTATPGATTTYTVIGYDDAGCFKDTGHVSIKVNPMPSVEAGLDKTVNIGQTLDLVPVISPDVSEVNWQPTTGVFRNSYPGISVKPVENTEYTVQVKNRGGCMARDRVSVFVICNGSNIFVPNTFSPNGDGSNDVFFARGTGLFKVKSLRIYTRWGEIVFEKTNFDANNPAYGWDGTKNGKKTNPDVFVYTMEVICDNGSVLTYRGNISLVK